MTGSPLGHAIEENDERLVATTLDLLGFDTQNPPGNTADIIGYIDRALSEAGLQTRRFGPPENPALIGWFSGRPPELLFNGHVDTVPFDRAAWTRDPLGERDGDTVYGRGATDMKGAVAAMIELVRAISETGISPSVPIGFLFNSDEETIGSEQLIETVEAFPTSPTTCVIGEMTGTTARPSVTVADKGSVWLTLSATGEAAHGSRPIMGRNAIDDLYTAIDALREELRAVEFDLHPDVTRILTESVAFYSPTVGEEAAWRLFERPTVNLGRFDGGQAINSVPTAATAEVDIRLTASVTPDPVVDRIRRFVSDRAGINIESIEFSQGTYEPPDGPLVETVSAASEAVTGERTLARSATGGGDAKPLRNHGLSAVEFALGTETAHAVDERMTRQALCQTAKIYAAVANRL